MTALVVSRLIPGQTLVGGTTLAVGVVDAAGTVCSLHTVPIDRPGRGDRILVNRLSGSDPNVWRGIP